MQASNENKSGIYRLPPLPVKTAPGRVHLVGAGPGDPDLLTVKALRLIQQTEVVVFDRLISGAIMDLVPANATRLYVGKQDGHHTLSQPEINQLLLTLARAGHDVVRLKGGDPFVFGRGSEEAQFLAEHGISFDVVPGVTAATACAGYAGIPLTHRGYARAVHFVTGHCAANSDTDVDWSSYTDPAVTVVIYMGLKNLPHIVSQLLAAGRAADTPAAAIENGTTPEQRRCITTLRDLPQRVVAAGIQAPALIVVGEVVSLAGQLDWFAVGTGQLRSGVLA